MVKIRCLWFAITVTAIGLFAMSGCNPGRVPQYEPKPGDKPLSKEDAAAAKAKTAEDFAKGYQEAQKRYGVDPNNSTAPPNMSKPPR